MSRDAWIHIGMPLPGPKAKVILEKDRRFVSPSYSRPYPLVAAEAQGMVVTDVDGNRFLDFSFEFAKDIAGYLKAKYYRLDQLNTVSLGNLIVMERDFLRKGIAKV